jgi:hypothetical protein
MINVVDGYVRGVARTSLDAAQVQQRTGLTDEQWYASRAPLLDKLIDPARYPTMRSFHDADVFAHPIDVFEFGLQRLLDGIEQLVRARSRQPADC